MTDSREPPSTGQLPGNWVPQQERQNTSKPISEAKKHSIEEGLDSVTDQLATEMKNSAEVCVCVYYENIRYCLSKVCDESIKFYNPHPFPYKEQFLPF